MDLQEQDRFHIHQKISWGMHRYRVFLDDGKGRPGPLAAYVDQDGRSLKDKVVLYTGEDKAEPLAEFRARRLVDVSAAFDVVTPDGAPIGSFRKDARRSLYRSTWSLEPEGAPVLAVAERNPTLAVVRRAWTFLPWVGEFPFPLRYHFDFARGGTVVAGVDRTGRLSDHYLAWSRDPALDRRLLIAMGVALDFRQGR